MIKFFLDTFLLAYSIIPLLFSITVYTVLAIVLAKSIKRHAKVYYWIFSIPFIIVLVPFFLRMMGLEAPSFNRFPIVSYFTRDYVHMATLGFPLLIIIMYMGALDTRNPYVARLMSIRKELSIIVGFPVLTHGVIRGFNALPTGWNFFFAHDEYMAKEQVVSMIGAGISSFVFVLGIVMLILFFILWVTSFTAIRRRMGNVLWKRVQKWAYVLYAMLFIHSIGLQIGGLLNMPPDRGQKIEQVTSQSERNIERKNIQQNRISGQPTDLKNASADNRENMKSGDNMQGEQITKDSRPKNGRNSLADIQIDRRTKSYVHIVSVLLVFGSYLILRIRKANCLRNK